MRKLVVGTVAAFVLAFGGMAADVDAKKGQSGICKMLSERLVYYEEMAEKYPRNAAAFEAAAAATGAQLVTFNCVK